MELLLRRTLHRSVILFIKALILGPSPEGEGGQTIK
jgi:hypothetical protein